MSEYSSDAAKLPVGRNAGKVVRIAWIDSYSLTREAVALSLMKMNPEVELSVFASIDAYLSDDFHDFALTLFFSHGPHQACLQAVSLLREASADMSLVVLSDVDVHQREEMSDDLRRAGADGLISIRESGLEAACAAVRCTQSDGARVLSAFGASPSGETDLQAQDAGPGITPRQREVLIQLQRGKSNKIIAYELGMSESTAKVHIRNLMKKMGARNRTQVAFNAMKLYPDLMPVG
jgi:DNA-binding NarL/FixJ family response regulator